MEVFGDEMIKRNRQISEGVKGTGGRGAGNEGGTAIRW